MKFHSVLFTLCVLILTSCNDGGSITNFPEEGFASLDKPTQAELKEKLKGLLESTNFSTLEGVDILSGFANVQIGDQRLSFDQVYYYQFYWEFEDYRIPLTQIVASNSTNSNRLHIAFEGHGNSQVYDLRNDFVGLNLILLDYYYYYAREGQLTIEFNSNFVQASFQNVAGLECYKRENGFFLCESNGKNISGIAETDNRLSSPPF